MVGGLAGDRLLLIAVGCVVLFCQLHISDAYTTPEQCEYRIQTCSLIALAACIAAAARTRYMDTLLLHPHILAAVSDYLALSALITGSRDSKMGMYCTVVTNIIWPSWQQLFCLWYNHSNRLMQL